MSSTIAGRRLIGYGGCQSLEAPSGYSDVVKSLLRDLGIDVSRFDTAYDQDFYKRHGLGGGVVFNREDWGVDRLVRYDLSAISEVISRWHRQICRPQRPCSKCRCPMPHVVRCYDC